MNELDEKSPHTRPPAPVERNGSPSGPRERGAPVLRPGDVLSGRYRIVEFIAHGGMGEVYEAEDQDLRERVALKTILPEVALDEHSLERFRREISHARKVTHPNVCRVFDLGHHRAAQDGGVERDLAFLTMELLAGETLSARLRRVGRMATTDALPIVTQMAAGLDAAHRAGLVHRDFKTGNVMLVPTGAAGLRAVITDFGLARLTRPDSSLSPETLTLSTAAVAGTPAYMAPEQLEGATATAATDIYALGLVLYEMVTGGRPYAGESALAAAVKRLSEPPPSPLASVADLDPRWVATILKCLERDPAARFTNAGNVVDALEGRIALAPPAAEVARRARRRRLTMIAGGLVVLGLAYLLLGLVRPQPPSAARLPPVHARKSVAVLGLQNLGGRPERAWLGTALGEMLTAELAAGGELRVVPRESVVRATRELTLPDASALTQEVLGRVHNSLGSDLVVLGSHASVGSQAQGAFRLELLMQDAKGGQPVEAVSEQATDASLAELVSRCGSRLRKKLRIAANADPGASANWGVPRTVEGLRLYAEGLEKLRAGDALGGRDMLEKAVAADPASPYARAALAESWLALGYGARAAQEAEKALALAETLPSESRLALEARFRALAGQADRAVVAYQSLFERRPDDVDYGLRLAAAQLEAGLSQRALATVDALRRIPPPVNADPRIDIAEARAAGPSDPQRQRSASARAAQLGRASGATGVVVSARLLEAMALRRLGDARQAASAAEEARRLAGAAGDRAGLATVLLASADLGGDGRPGAGTEALAKARELFHEAGDRKGEAAALSSLAAEARAAGDLQAARKTLDEVLAIQREIADQGGLAATLRQIGIIQTTQGDTAGARASYEQALTELRAVESRKSRATLLLELAALHVAEGDWARARTPYEEAAAALRDSGDTHAAAAALQELAGVLRNQGDLAAAKRAYGESLAAFRETGDAAGGSIALARMGGVLLLQGDLATARALLEEMREARRAAGDSSGAARAAGALAAVLLEQGDPAAAVRVGEETLRLLGGAADPALRAQVLRALGTALHVRGEAAEARRRFESVRQLRKKDDTRGLAEDNLDLAWLALEEGRASEAETSARQAADSLRTAHLSDDEAEAQVLLCRALLEGGNLSAAQAAAARAQALVAESDRLPLRLSVGLVAARVHARAGQVAEAASEARAVSAQAEKAGLGRLRWEAALTLGEVEIAAGRPSAGQDRLAALEREAATRGFGLFARRASALSKAPAARP
jgi:Tfp pilus assembly protein PilF